MSELILSGTLLMATESLVALRSVRIIVDVSNVTVDLAESILVQVFLYVLSTLFSDLVLLSEASGHPMPVLRPSFVSLLSSCSQVTLIIQD